MIIDANELNVHAPPPDDVCVVGSDPVRLRDLARREGPALSSQPVLGDIDRLRPIHA